MGQRLHAGQLSSGRARAWRPPARFSPQQGEPFDLQWARGQIWHGAVLINLGDVAREQGDENQAVALYTDALAMYREVGNERGMDRALGRLAPR